MDYGAAILNSVASLTMTVWIGGLIFFLLIALVLKNQRAIGRDQDEIFERLREKDELR